MGNSTSFPYSLPQHHHHHPTPSTTHAHTHAHRRGTCLTSAACRKDLTEPVELVTQHYIFDRERGWSDPLYVSEELRLLRSAEMLGLGGSGCGSESGSGASVGECKVCA